MAVYCEQKLLQYMKHSENETDENHGQNIVASRQIEE